MTLNRRLVILVALVGVLFVTTGVGTVAAQSAPDCSTVTYNGDGTEANPYEVSNVDQLQCIEEQDLDANYVQVSDIDAGGTASWNGGDGFDPIGGPPVPVSGPPFEGKFVGQGYSITDLTINRDSKNRVGMFGGLDRSGEVTTVSVVDANITGNDEVGGIVGLNAGTIDKSYVTGSINGTDDVGGLIGRNRGESTVSTSYSTASVSGNGFDVGGLVGGNGGMITESYATGSVDGTDDVGGLVGTNSGTVSKSYATASVNGPEDVGGLVGFNVGGGMVSESYATGLVDGSNRVGGLVGLNAESMVSESYWDTETTGQSSSQGGTGLTTSEMTGTAATSNMAGFDFTSTWETVTNPNDYPVLAWESEEEENTPPTASFTYTPSSPDTSESITFDASGSSDSDGNIQRYDWDFGDGSTATATGETVTHTYTNPGTYAVTLTVIDGDGATDSTTTTVEVRDPSESPVEGVSDELWNTVTADDGSDGLSLADLGNAIQEYRSNPGNAEVGGVGIGLSDLGSLIQHYRNEVA
jgi:PKD repeat protein